MKSKKSTSLPVMAPKGLKPRSTDSANKENGGIRRSRLTLPRTVNKSVPQRTVVTVVEAAKTMKAANWNPCVSVAPLDDHEVFPLTQAEIIAADKDDKQFPLSGTYRSRPKNGSSDYCTRFRKSSTCVIAIKLTSHRPFDGGDNNLRRVDHHLWAGCVWDSACITHPEEHSPLIEYFTNDESFPRVIPWSE